MTKQTHIYQALLRVLAYSDIFDYPLTGEQLFRFLEIPISRKDFFSSIKTLPFIVRNNTLYYFLPRRQMTVTKRLTREKISKKKLHNARPYLRKLAYIPFIRFIGISGSLALLNAEKSDDTDLFIITAKNTVWMTRCIVYLLLHMWGVKKGKKKNGNAICANMFVDESNLQIARSKRNIYTAHEIMQVMQIVDKSQIWKKYLQKNKWVTTYFPNIILPKKVSVSKNNLSSLLAPVEYLFRNIQLWYMQSKKTREITNATHIAFHPIDYEGKILSAYTKKIQKIQKYFSHQSVGKSKSLRKNSLQHSSRQGRLRPNNLYTYGI